MAKLSRKEACNVLEKYTDISMNKDVIEAHNMAIDALRKTCKNCLNSNPHITKSIDEKNALIAIISRCIWKLTNQGIMLMVVGLACGRTV